MITGAAHGPEENEFVAQLYEAAGTTDIERLYKVLVTAGCIMTPEQYESFGAVEMQNAMAKYNSFGPMNDDYFQRIAEAAEQTP